MSNDAVALEYARLRDTLRSAARSVYVVNEKRPPSYDRQWRIHVLWRDGTTTTVWTNDSDDARNAELRRLLLDPRAAIEAAP